MLQQYQEKRNFNITPEPAGTTRVSVKRLRFAVQHHLARRDHFDFRLEWNGVLMSWAVPKGPSFNPADKRLAVRVEDHPFDYRDFEGTIPKGEYGGGTVMLWDEGFWTPLGSPDKDLKNGMLKFNLKGKRLKGNWALVRLKDDDKNWLLLKEKDGYELDDSGIDSFDTSIKTGRTMGKIAQNTQEKQFKNPFSSLKPQLLTQVENPPEGKDWIYELKYDGYRTICFCQNGQTRLFSRNETDLSKKFESLVTALNELSHNRAFVADGEVVILDERGKSDFQALQNYPDKKSTGTLAYIIFDLLALDGQDLRDTPLIKRKEKLKRLLKNAPQGLCFSDFWQGNGKQSFQAACKLGLEGIVCKKAQSAYVSGRSDSWVKVKCDNRQEFVIGGYTVTEKSRGGVSALLLGYFENGELRYIGRTGTGFTQKSAVDLRTKLDKLTRKTPSFAIVPKTEKNEKTVWVRPQLIAEVKYAQITADNLLRQASFKGMRTDKPATEVKLENTHPTPINQSSAKKVKPTSKYKDDSLDIGGIKVTNPQKIIYENPDITKAQVAEYYQQVAALMLPYMEKRVLSIVRCPQGVKTDCFYKKHPDRKSGGITTVSVTGSDGQKDEYFYIESVEGLLNEAQMGTLEFHIWGSLAPRIDSPDTMVFDLDPDAGMPLSQVRQGVRDVKKILDERGLKSFLKTSGGKGYHIVVPVLPQKDWKEFSVYARGVADEAVRRWPERYTANIRKVKRQGKIFIDWIRNSRGATSVAPYSLRARKGAAVSFPLTWRQLNLVAPNEITLQNALLRIKKANPWEGYFDVKQGLD